MYNSQSMVVGLCLPFQTGLDLGLAFIVMTFYTNYVHTSLCSSISVHCWERVFEIRPIKELYSLL